MKEPIKNCTCSLCDQTRVEKAFRDFAVYSTLVILLVYAVVVTLYVTSSAKPVVTRPGPAPDFTLWPEDGPPR